MQETKMFYVGFHGQAMQDKVFIEALGTDKRDFWFDSDTAATSFKNNAQVIAGNLGLILASRCEIDEHPHKKLIAKMDCVLPDGKRYPIEFDFGFCYSEAAAEYMFFEGNYSCDCNKSIFIGEQYTEFEEMDCGDTIQLENFTVNFV